MFEIEMTDWIQGRMKGICTPCKLRWSSLAETQQHTLETGHMTLWTRDVGLIISRRFVETEALA